MRRSRHGRFSPRLDSAWVRLCAETSNAAGDRHQWRGRYIIIADSSFQLSNLARISPLFDFIAIPS